MSGMYAVILGDPTLEDPDTIQKVAGVLAGVAGIAAYDAAHQVKNAEGILMDNIPADQAQQAASQLNAQGIKAAAADTSRLGARPEVQKVREIAVTPESLSVQLGYTGSMETIPWGKVGLASVCLHFEHKQKIVLKKDTSGKTLLRAGLMAGMFGVPGMIMGARIVHKAMRETRQSVQRIKQKPGEGESYVLDLHVHEPARVLRLQSNVCSYKYLSDRLEPATEHNFQNVVGDIASMTEVPLSPTAQRFLAGDSLSDFKIENLELFERYNRWLYLSATAFGEET